MQPVVHIPSALHCVLLFFVLFFLLSLVHTPFLLFIFLAYLGFGFGLLGRRGAAFCHGSQENDFGKNLSLSFLYEARDRVIDT